MLPKWLRPYLKEEGLGRIEEAVRKAEKRSRGEIVPMVVRRSASVGHLPRTLALLLTVLFLLCQEPFIGWQPRSHALLFPALAVAAAIVLGHLLARRPFFQRRFSHHADRRRAAWQRAELALYRRGLDRTKGSTGILLFLSIEDRQAVVLADKAIAAKLPKETWDEVCEMILRGARQRDLANGFQAAIARCASLLEKDFPAKAKDKDELPDALIIED